MNDEDGLSWSDMRELDNLDDSDVRVNWLEGFAIGLIVATIAAMFFV